MALNGVMVPKKISKFTFSRMEKEFRMRMLVCNFKLLDVNVLLPLSMTSQTVRTESLYL